MTTDAKKILILAHSATRGGAEYCLDTTLRHLDRERFDATVLFAWDGPMADSARELGYRVEIVPLSWWMCYARVFWHYKNLLGGSLVRAWRLARRIRRERFELVYSNTAVVFEGALAARLAGVPHVWHVHEVMTPDHMRPRMLPLRLITRLIGRWSDRVIFESDSSRGICRERISAKKSLTVYNSVRFPDPEPVGDTAEVRGRFGLDEDRVLFLWIGRFSERKNPLLLLRAAAKMKEAGRAQFAFIGEGPLEGHMRETIDQLRLADTCRIVPFQDDVRPLLAAADSLVLTSDEESFGLVLVEAGVYGLPVVATRVQGPSEIVADGETGFLVPPGDEAELADRLDRLVGSPEHCQRMGRAGAKRVAERFHPARNTRKIEAVFDELLGTQRVEEPAAV